MREEAVNVEIKMLLAEFIGLFVAFALAMFIPAATLRWVAGLGFPITILWLRCYCESMAA